MKKATLFALCVAAGSMTCLTPAYAQTVKNIQITGNQRVEDSTVMSYLQVHDGDTYSPPLASEALKALYATGLFSNVEVSWDDKADTLVVKLVENPIINEVRFEGNDTLNTTQLKKLVSLHSRSIFTAGKVQEDVNSILTSYRQVGHYLAKVEPQIIRLDQNRVNLIYKINEGSKTRIERIDFVGNHAFSDGDLKDIVSTRESAWWRFLSTADSYDPDRLEFDKELLRRFYLKNGYADFHVVSAVAELTRDKKAFFITFTVDEGKVYKFGKLGVKVADKDVDIKPDVLKKELKMKTGERYNATEVEDTINGLVDALGRKGYAFLDVQPEVNKDRDSRTIDIDFVVKPGPRVYVGKINIEGNTHTRDYVIRREMRLAEGDAFSSSKLKRSQERIRMLGFFDNVEIKRQETGQPDKVDLDVKVKEQSTGEFNIGAGFSTYEGALATTDVHERNFLGRGQDMLLSFAISQKRQDINAAFTEPYFMGRDVSAGVRAFNTRTDYQHEASYDEERSGGGFVFGVPLSEYTRNQVEFTYAQSKISNVDDDASIFIKQEAGSTNSMLVGDSVTYDSRDNPMNPNNGTRLMGQVQYSGFGASEQFVRTQFTASRYITLADQWVLGLGARAGYLQDIGDSTPIFENFQLGGLTLRGFDQQGIGPRDKQTRDALGGKIMAGHNIELRFPLPGGNDTGLNGVLFTDGGIVTDFEQSSPLVADSKLYRISVGVGLFWRSPLGPMRFDFGFPVVKSSEDRVQIFSFNFGARF